jgi:hypothetical protein
MNTLLWCGKGRVGTILENKNAANRLNNTFDVKVERFLCCRVLFMSDFPAPPTSNSSRFGWLRRRILKIPVWAWIVVVLVIGGVASAGSPSEQTSSPVKTTDAPTTDAPTTDAPTTEAPEPSETIGQENARESAQNYLNAMSFSRSGLIDQLLFEGFSQAEAEYGVNAVGF